MTKKSFILAAALVVAFAACGGTESSDGGDTATDPGTASVEAAGDAAQGETIFTATCASCHGPTGEGIEGLGKPMPGSTFISGLSDAELVAFIKAGRSTSDPANSTGVDMPAKGGNPSLSDEDLADVVAYIRSLG
jgi:disulfide bond formation protein DsbB